MQSAAPAPGKYKAEIRKTGCIDLHTRTHPRGLGTALTFFCLHLFYLAVFVSAVNIIATIFEKDAYGFCIGDSTGVTYTRDSHFEGEHVCVHAVSKAGSW